MLNVLLSLLQLFCKRRHATRFKATRPSDSSVSSESATHGSVNRATRFRFPVATRFRFPVARAAAFNNGQTGDGGDVSIAKQSRA
jgi:hypothetical protein